MITLASFQDIPELVNLINSAYRGEGSKQGWTTEADLIGGLRTDYDHLQEIFNDPDTTFLKFIDETDSIIACVRLQKKEDRIYLGMLSVSPKLQAKGIGKQLLTAAEDYARQQNCRAIFMTVFSVRPELVAWYERHGYHKTGETIPFQPNEKFEVVMTQELEFLVLEKKLN
ncbi:MAG: GNAT family N-acetyltransferase [Saprospiraceae bacterium]|nr:GNAT family N-acetyltransferase [Saprospiraceae bacterium]